MCLNSASFQGWHSSIANEDKCRANMAKQDNFLAEVVKQNSKCIVDFSKEDMCAMAKVEKDNICWPHNKGFNQHGAL